MPYQATSLLIDEEAYTKEAETVCQELRSNFESGLSEAEAQKRLSYFGPNKIPTGKTLNLLTLFLKQFKDFMILVLMGVAAISYVSHEVKDAIVIMAVVVINTLLGFYQEYKAEKTIESLKKSASPKARVMREEKVKIIPTQEVVPGDILIIEEGDMVQADGRLFELIHLSTMESFLTGESLPVLKTKETLDKKNISIGDRINTVYRGSTVASGHGRVIVTHTGEDTELGKIAHLITEIKDQPTPLELKLKALGKNLVMLTIILCLLVATIGILQGLPTLMMLKTAVVLGVSCIPEGLVAVVTIALALGVQRMAKKKAIIRRLPAVETLGAVTTICSDKTGTLTQGQMMAQTILFPEQEIQITGHGIEPEGDFLMEGKKITHFTPDQELLFTAAALCNNATLQVKENTWEAFGDPTEVALMVMAAKAKYFNEELQERFRFLNEAHFDTLRKCMSKVFTDQKTQETYIFTKGAPEKILEISHLEASQKEALQKKVDTYTLQGFRVLAMATQKISDAQKHQRPTFLEKDLILLGFVAISDPIRKETPLAIQKCQEAGIQTLILTGDHLNTATYIGEKLGIAKNKAQVIHSEKLENLSHAAFDEAMTQHTVLARVSPQIKLKVVESFRRQNQIVAMTGDGVNDAPAIKRANIGIAMGRAGTDVAKEAADIVLADDNFATIVAAIEEGRTIYDNILKFIRYLLSCNMGEIFIMLIATLFALPLPFLPIQILWLNLVTDTPPALALGVDPASSDVMQRPPRHPKSSLFSRPMIHDVLLNGFIMSLIVLGIFLYELYIENTTLPKARTLSFSTLVFVQLFHAFNCQSRAQSIFKTGLFTNKYLIFAILISIFLLLAGLYIPNLKTIFELTSLSLFEWGKCFGISIFIIAAVELQKVFLRKKA